MLMTLIIGGFLTSLDRDGLTVPGDSACRKAIFRSVIINVIKNKDGRLSQS